MKGYPRFPTEGRRVSVGCSTDDWKNCRQTPQRRQAALPVAEIFLTHSLYKNNKIMKFRQYVSTNDVPVGRARLTEANLIGTPSLGTSSTDPRGSQSPSQAALGDQPSENGSPLGSGRSTDQMDDQLKKAQAMATELNVYRMGPAQALYMRQDTSIRREVPEKNRNHAFPSSLGIKPK